MAPATKNGATSNGHDEVTKQYVDYTMAEIRQSLTNLKSKITALSIQNNQVVNIGIGRQANQLSRLAKVLFPMFQGDDVRS